MDKWCLAPVSLALLLRLQRDQLHLRYPDAAPCPQEQSPLVRDVSPDKRLFDELAVVALPALQRDRLFVLAF